MDQKGQISIEFVLIIAFMLIMVLLFVPYIGEQNELNTISLAAKSGAINATTTLVLLDSKADPVTVNNIKMIGSGYNLTIQIDLSGSVSNETQVLNGILKSIASQGYTLEGNGTATVLDDFIVTSRHRYNVILV